MSIKLHQAGGDKGDSPRSHRKHVEEEASPARVRVAAASLACMPPSSMQAWGVLERELHKMARTSLSFPLASHSKQSQKVPRAMWLHIPPRSA